MLTIFISFVNLYSKIFLLMRSRTNGTKSVKTDHRSDIFRKNNPLAPESHSQYIRNMTPLPSPPFESQTQRDFPPTAGRHQFSSETRTFAWSDFTNKRSGYWVFSDIWESFGDGYFFETFSILRSSYFIILCSVECFQSRSLYFYIKGEWRRLKIYMKGNIGRSLYKKMLILIILLFINHKVNKIKICKSGSG